MQTFKDLFIGGEWVAPSSSEIIEVISPATEEVIGQVPHASFEDADRAVAAARKAFAGWSGATAYNRGQVLYRVAELLEGRRE